MAIQCSRCGTELEQDAAVCIHCGNTVQLQPAPAFAFAPATEHALELEHIPPVNDAPAFFSPTTEDPTNRLVGIEGWLCLVAIRLALSPLLIFRTLVATDLPFFTHQAWQTYFHEHPAVAGVIFFETSANLVYLVMLVWLNYLFYKKKRSFPTLMILLVILQLAVATTDSVLIRLVLHSFEEGVLSVHVLADLVAAAIWIPYFLVSRRVKMTFVR